MRRAIALSSLRSCVRATSAYSIVQAKILSHFLRSESATLAFAQAFSHVSREVVIRHSVDVVEDHLADVESFGAPSLLRHDFETALDVFGKSNRSRHRIDSRILVVDVFIVSQRIHLKSYDRSIFRAMKNTFAGRSPSRRIK